MVPKVWHLLPHDPARVEQLAIDAGVSRTVAQLLINRGLTTAASARRFLDSPIKGLHAPELLPGLADAAGKLFEAVRQKRQVCIYGDYDVDGVTGTAILCRQLALMDAKVRFYTPRRLEEGYGVNREAIRTLAGEGVQTIVTVDCGITSIAEAELARELGVQFIITDHHEMRETLPAADAIVHPRLPGSDYPFTGLSGAGVAFKLAWALAKLACGSEKVTEGHREALLDAVALATLGLVADVVPLQDENRILTRHGLLRLQTRPPLGMKALIESAKLTPDKPLKAEDIGYRLAPRMNAAGRLGFAGMVVEMLTTASPAKAHEIAQYLETQNEERQAIERKMVAQAREQLEGVDLQALSAAVLFDPQWHPGVIGIVAGRIAEQIGRPTLVIAQPEGQPHASGSGRSIAGFALHEALKACGDLLVTHGGHAAAAGFKVEPGRIDALRERFQAHAAAHFPRGVPAAPRLILDAELPLVSLNLKLMEEIDQLEPYGADNPKPKFLIPRLQIDGEPRRMGKGDVHLSFKVRQGSYSLRVVAWSKGDEVERLMSQGGACSLVATPVVNEWQGRRNVELHLVDYQPGHEVQLG